MAGKISKILKYIQQFYRIMTKDLKKYKLVAGDPEVNQKDESQVRVKIYRADNWGKILDKNVYFTVQYSNSTELDEDGVPVDNNFHDVVFQEPGKSNWVDPHTTVSLDEWYKLLDSYAKKWLDTKLGDTVAKFDNSSSSSEDETSEDESINTSIRVLSERRILG